jgi:hypothetical protein
MQLVPFQPGPRPDPPPIEFLIAFTQHLIHMNPSPDLLELAMLHAMRKVNVTKEQARMFVVAVLLEKDKSPWPKGFF